MKQYLAAILILCGVATAGERFVLRTVDHTADGLPIVELEKVEKPKPEPPPVPEPPTPEPPKVARELLDAQQRDVLKRLWKDKHPWAVQVQTMADWGPPAAYGDFGQWATLVYLATGNEVYAQKAYERADSILTPWAEFPENRNELREYFVPLLTLYHSLRPALTNEQATHWRTVMLRWSDLALQPVGASWGTRIGDDDETVGHYFGLILTAKYFAAEEPERCKAILANPQIPLMRAEIKRLCALAKGGAWVGSSFYNPATLQYLFIGAYSAGIADYPEVAQLAAEVAVQQQWMNTPDLKDAAQYGDVQDVHQPSLSNNVALTAMVAGLTGNQQARSLVAALTQGVRIYPNYWMGLPNALACFDPSEPVEPFVAPTGFRSTHMGLNICRGPNYFCQIQHVVPLAVDHEGGLNPDVRLWLDGEWPLDHPMGYEASSSCCNTALIAGFARFERMELVSAEATADGCKVVNSIGGKLPDSFATFLDDWTRTTEFHAPNKIAVTDRFKGQRPDLSKIPNQRFKDIVTSSPALYQVVYHCPVEPTEIEGGFMWQTQRGKTVAVRGPPRRMKMKTAESPDRGGYFIAGQLDGWQVRFLNDSPTAEIKTTVEVTQ